MPFYSIHRFKRIDTVVHVDNIVLSSDQPPNHMIIIYCMIYRFVWLDLISISIDRETVIDMYVWDKLRSRFWINCPNKVFSIGWKRVYKTGKNRIKRINFGDLLILIYDLGWPWKILSKPFPLLNTFIHSPINLSPYPDFHQQQKKCKSHWGFKKP